MDLTVIREEIVNLERLSEKILDSLSKEIESNEKKHLAEIQELNNINTKRIQSLRNAVIKAINSEVDTDGIL